MEGLRSTGLPHLVSCIKCLKSITERKMDKAPFLKHFHLLLKNCWRGGRFLFVPSPEFQTVMNGDLLSDNDNYGFFTELSSSRNKLSYLYFWEILNPEDIKIE